MEALAVHALVAGAGIAVIHHTVEIVYANTGLRLAKIRRAKILVIAILLDVETLPVHAKVVCTGNVIVQQAGGCEPANTVYASIIRTGDAIITHLGRVDTYAVHTSIIRTRAGIGAISRCKKTFAEHATVNRTQVIVITNDRRESTKSA